MLGGSNNGTFTNDFYSITVDADSHTYNMEKITSDHGPRPCARRGHTMEKLGETAIVVYGGNNGNPLHDISVYDFVHKKWF